MEKWIQIVLTRLVDLIFPQRCLLCDELLELADEIVCHRCDLSRFLIDSNTCKKCGRPISLIDDYCSDCKDKTSYFDRGMALLKYEGILHSSMYRLKYGNRKDVGYQLGRLIGVTYKQAIESLQIERLIPIPLHKDRYKNRGYNQATLIAKGIANVLDIPIDINLLKRTKNTKPQSGLGIRERQNNLKTAFQLTKEIECHRVMLIDDIYTTGSTINTCAHILKEAGVHQVYFMVAAIAMG